MGSLKLEQREKVEADQERGQEITEVGEQKLEEAEVSNEAISQIEAIDDDDKAALDAARSEASEIAKEVAESDIKSPWEEVSGSLEATASESREYSETERQDAEKAAEMTGDYSETGAGLSETLEASGEEFEDIAEQSDQVNEEKSAELEQLMANLEGVF